MSTPTTPAARPAIWAESGTKVEPDTGTQQSGFVAGKPGRGKTNWLLNWLDNAVQFILLGYQTAADVAAAIAAVFSHASATSAVTLTSINAGATMNAVKYTTPGLKRIVVSVGGVDQAHASGFGVTLAKVGGFATFVFGHGTTKSSASIDPDTVVRVFLASSDADNLYLTVESGAPNQSLGATANFDFVLEGY